LTAAQQAALLAAADRSPVLALLSPAIVAITRLGPIDDPGQAERKAEIAHWVVLQQALRAP
jgi:hypothetical protein